MNSNLLFQARITEHYELLSNSEKKIADYLIKNYESVSNLNTQELSDKTDTSPATIVRFCRSIGFKGITDLKYYMSSESLTPFDDLTEINENDSVRTIKQKTFNFNRRAMEETLSILDDAVIQSAVEAIDKAKQVAIIAEGGSGASARTAFDTFLQIDIPCILLEDAIFQVIGASKLTKEDVALVVCHSGQSRNVVEGIAVAKQAGAITIGIVGIVGSPIVEHLDIVIYTGITAHPFFSDMIAARISELNVISTLHGALSIARNQKIKDFRKKINELLSIKRIKK